MNQRESQANNRLFCQCKHLKYNSLNKCMEILWLLYKLSRIKANLETQWLDMNKCNNRLIINNHNIMILIKAHHSCINYLNKISKMLWTISLSTIIWISKMWIRIDQGLQWSLCKTMDQCYLPANSKMECIQFQLLFLHV